MEWHKDNHHIIKQTENHDHVVWHSLLKIGKNEICTNTKPNIIICKSGGQKISSIHQWQPSKAAACKGCDLLKMLWNMNKKTTCEFFQVIPTT